MYHKHTWAKAHTSFISGMQCYNWGSQPSAITRRRCRRRTSSYQKHSVSVLCESRKITFSWHRLYLCTAELVHRNENLFTEIFICTSIALVEMQKFMTLADAKLWSDANGSHLQKESHKLQREMCLLPHTIYTLQQLTNARFRVDNHCTTEQCCASA